MRNRSILKRRELLMSLGAAGFLAAPVFRETLVEAQALKLPTRFVPIYLPACSTAGRFNFAQDMAPLAPYAPDGIVFENVNNAAGQSVWGVTGEPHAAELRTLLTGDSSVKPRENASVWAPSDSIDQIIADELSWPLKFTSLQFGVVSETRSNPLDQRRVIFRQGAPQTPVQDPVEMFERLFGTGLPGTGSGPSEAVSPELARARGKSVLDQLVGEVTALKAVAGTPEQAKLDQHLTSLRELEKQVVGGMPAGDKGLAAYAPGSSCAPPTITPVSYGQAYPPGSGPGPDIPGVADRQFRLLYEALNCDLTRVASMQLLGTAHTEVSFEWLGVRDDHHALEHSGGGAVSNMQKVQSFFAQEIAKFLGYLKATPEGTGTMLDNTVVLFFSDFSDGADHSHARIPFFMFGRGGGRVSVGRTVNYSGQPHNLLLRSVLNVFGIERANVGDEVSGTPISLS
jgi:hypothetical protein